MIRELLLGLFCALAITDWGMVSVQRTVQLICRANGESLNSLSIQLLLPKFVRAALFITLAEWTVAALYGWYVSLAQAAALLFSTWLIKVSTPTPHSFVLPSIRRKISLVRSLSPEDGEQLLRMVAVWEREGRPVLWPENRALLASRQENYSDRTDMKKVVFIWALALLLALLTLFLAFRQ